MEEKLSILKNMLMKNKILSGCIAIFLIIVISLISLFFINFKTSDQKEDLPLQESKIITSEMMNEWFVDVKGEVKYPNVYAVKQNMRVKDVIEMAGGFTENANKSVINLAENVVDEMVIDVPNVYSTSDISQVNSKINLNTAQKQELLQIEGIGEKKADAILEYRQKVKRIKEFDDLKNIKGFSQKLIDKLKEVCKL